MSFNIFMTNTSAVASQLMENFYYLGGDRMPYSGNSLTAVDDTYNLGSSAYRWNDLYCNSFEAPDSITSTESWINITNETLVLTASSIEITGLAHDEIEINFSLIDNTATIAYMIINGDSATNYGYYEMAIIHTVGTSSTYSVPIHTRNTNSSAIILNDTSARQTSSAIYSYSHNRIFAKVGFPRIISIVTAVHDIGTNTYTTFWIESIKFKTYSWNNKVDAITSIKIYGSESNSFDPGTKISIWGKT